MEGTLLFQARAEGVQWFQTEIDGDRRFQTETERALLIQTEMEGAWQFQAETEEAQIPEAVRESRLGLSRLGERELSGFMLRRKELGGSNWDEGARRFKFGHRQLGNCGPAVREDIG